MLFGLVLAYSGAALYSIRKYQDRRRAGLPGITGSRHPKLTGAMLAVPILDGAGHLLAVGNVPTTHTALIAALEDIFVAVAILTISVGLILPGRIAHSAMEVAQAAEKLARGTVADPSRAMAKSFNIPQHEIGVAARSLEGGRVGLREARREIVAANAQLEQHVRDLDVALQQQRQTEDKLDIARQLAQLLGGQIDFTNLPGQGSTFWIALPVGMVRAAPATAGAAGASMRGAPDKLEARALLADDNPVNQKVASTMLRSLG